MQKKRPKKPQSKCFAHYIWFPGLHYRHLEQRCKAEGFRNVPELVRAIVRQDYERAQALAAA